MLSKVQCGTVHVHKFGFSLLATFYQEQIQISVLLYLERFKWYNSACPLTPIKWHAAWAVHAHVFTIKAEPFIGLVVFLLFVI